ncbi:terpenoid synthase [Canariomyces notabilis]|uniref:Terpene synthase n=1 Tax=Canariomyces notabilis TaxID=2074819 RepID=A0AAN6QBZ9_9PEZI|nr:terpenoid synthase [Canariomyces arenarius]
MPATTQPVIHLPDTLRHWPWPRTINPHYEDCKRESEAWIESFRAFSPRAQRAYNRCNFSLLSSLAWANLNREGCRIGCDLMHLFFVFDEHSDRSSADETRQQAEAIMDALRNPQKARPAHEFIGGRVAQEYWLRAIQSTPASFQRRFITSFQRYTESVVQQSSDREQARQRDLPSYLALRRYTIGAEPSFVLNAMHMDLPEHVVAHPTLRRLEHLATDMIIIGNDVVSYDREQSQPDQAEHNIISVVMAAQHCSVQEAMDWVGRFHDELVDSFLAEYKSLPEFPQEQESEAVNEHVREYANALANWVRASDCWGFESERYFGKDGMRVAKERTVVLRPKQLGKVEVAIAPPPLVAVHEVRHELPVTTTASVGRRIWDFLGALLKRANIFI